MTDVIPKIEITDKILKLLLEIAKLEDRIYNLPLKGRWRRDLSDLSIKKSSIFGYFLDNKLLIDIKISRSKRDRKQIIISNEVEVRKSFSLYFNNDHLHIELLEYLHRFLENIQGEDIKNRGRFRKGQEDIKELEYLSNLKSVIPRYGFIRRNLEELFEYINESETNEYILSALIFLALIKILPFNNSNFRIARIVSKGFLYIRGIDLKHFVSIEEQFMLDFQQYFSCLNKAIIKNPDEWVLFFLKKILVSYEVTAQEIEKISGGTIKPLTNEIINVTKRQKMIIELLKKNNQMSGSEIATILKVSRQNIFVIMQKLMKKGVVTKVGNGPSSRYKLNTKMQTNFNF